LNKYGQPVAAGTRPQNDQILRESLEQLLK